MPERTPVRSTRTDTPSAAGGRVPLWGLIDTTLILIFAVAGRRTHEHGVTVAGVLETAWPFLLAYLGAAVAVRAWRRPAALRPTALVLWIGTVAGGLALRALSGAGVALSFQVVALLVLGAFLVLPRVASRSLARRGRRSR